MAATISQSNGVHSHVGIGASETLTAIELVESRGLAVSVHAMDGGGTGFNSGTITIQISFDGTNYITAKDLLGTDVTFTADGYAEISTSAKKLRVVSDSSISDVDVFVAMPA